MLFINANYEYCKLQISLYDTTLESRETSTSENFLNNERSYEKKSRKRDTINHKHNLHGLKRKSSGKEEKRGKRERKISRERVRQSSGEATVIFRRRNTRVSSLETISDVLFAKRCSLRPKCASPT